MRRALFMVMCIVALLVFAGCGESVEPEVDTASSQSPLTTECQPSPEYDTCTEIDIKQAHYWQDYIGDDKVPWREVLLEKNGPAKYRVILNAEKFNGGVVLAQKNQGQYADEDAFIQAYLDLTGLPEATGHILEIVGSTLKLDESGYPSSGSTGDFIYDALSDENGKIWLDGEDVTDLAFDKARFDSFDVIIDDKAVEGDESIGQIEQAAVTSDNMQGGNGFSAKLNLVDKGWIVPKLGGKISNVSNNGLKCRWTWNPFKLFRECYKADLRLELSFDRLISPFNGTGYGTSYTLTYGWFFFEDGPNATCVRGEGRFGDGWPGYGTVYNWSGCGSVY